MAFLAFRTLWLSPKFYINFELWATYYKSKIISIVAHFSKLLSLKTHFLCSALPMAFQILKNGKIIVSNDIIN